ncbi:MAG: nucleotidyltransferase domain-containing protein [Acidimicrobiia bacterium]
MTAAGGNETPPFQPERIIAVLNEHHVDYVVIGGMGAILHGAPMPPTKDIDVTPEASRANLGRLSAALRDLGATLRAPGLTEGVVIPLDERTFDRMTTMTFFTEAGPFDVSLRPDGTDGYPDLVRSAVRVEFHGRPVPVAALEDIIRSKNGAGRPKDQATLPELERFAQERTRAARLAAQAYPEAIDAACDQATSRTSADQPDSPGRSTGDGHGECRGQSRSTDR